MVNTNERQNLDQDPAVTQVMEVLLATGMSRWGMVGHLASTFGIQSVSKAEFNPYMAESSPDEALTAVSMVCDICGEIANDLHQAWLVQANPIPEGLLLLEFDWMTSLPNNLKVRGDMVIDGCKHFHALPEGLTVEGDLNLYRCQPDSYEPFGLFVTGNFYI